MRDGGSTNRGGRLPRNWQVIWLLYLLVAAGILFYAYFDRGISRFDPTTNEFKGLPKDVQEAIIHMGRFEPWAEDSEGSGRMDRKLLACG